MSYTLCALLAHTSLHGPPPIIITLEPIFKGPFGLWMMAEVDGNYVSLSIEESLAKKKIIRLSTTCIRCKVPSDLC